MINISTNGIPQVLENTMTLAQYLDIKEIATGKYVVAVDQTFVPKSQYASFLLQDGHQIDVLIAMQGG